MDNFTPQNIESNQSFETTHARVVSQISESWCPCASVAARDAAGTPLTLLDVDGFEIMVNTSQTSENSCPGTSLDVDGL